MSGPKLARPMGGCGVVTSGAEGILFGQPPEVLKALLQARLQSLDALVLPDVRERSGVLLNNLEFLLYYFLFFEKGLENGRRLKLIGEATHIAQALEILRLTLVGPSADELRAWQTDAEQATEWLNSARFFALKDEQGAIRPVESFFELLPFRNGVVDAGSYQIRRLDADRFEVTDRDGRVEVDLNEADPVRPPYRVTADYIPAGLAKFAIEVLGGASGFSAEEPSTGFALCFNGHYILIDAIPYLDQHLKARGISKNQLSALFLTHLHDDHCNMFPLMRMPRKVDVITTREIFAMAVRKLAMGLGWTDAAVAEHFNFVEVRAGRTLDYYGLKIEPHHPVHSIPTVGATFRAMQQGRAYEICLVGDIQTFAEIAEMRRLGLVRRETEETLRELYRRRYDLLIADGGMGPIHGDPADALDSQAERVVFVHVEELPEKFNATFSLASAGKRYVVLDGDSDIYTTRTIEFLMASFDQPIAPRWLGTLFADKKVKRYNTDDVIFKQSSATWGDVFLILTGYCEVVFHDGEGFHVLGTREAGELMGEMAVVTGTHRRNASVVARTPVLACEFSEETFNTFLEEEGLKDQVLASWARRPLVSALPQFKGLGTTVIDALCKACETVRLEPGVPVPNGSDGPAWNIVCAGVVVEAGSGRRLGLGAELGPYRPYARSTSPKRARLRVEEALTLVRFPRATAERLLAGIPQLSYGLRKYRGRDGRGGLEWAFDGVPESIVLASGSTPSPPPR